MNSFLFPEMSCLVLSINFMKFLKEFLRWNIYSFKNAPLVNQFHCHCTTLDMCPFHSGRLLHCIACSLGIAEIFPVGPHVYWVTQRNTEQISFSLEYRLIHGQDCWNEKQDVFSQQIVTINDLRLKLFLLYVPIVWEIVWQRKDLD